MSNGWGGRINYTYSRLKDNQFGETQLLLSALNGEACRTPTISTPNTRSACSTCRTRSSISPIIELPFGEGKQWAQSGVGAAILGDWTISSIIALRERLPVAIRNSNNRQPVHAHAARQSRHGDAETDGTR